MGNICSNLFQETLLLVNEHFTTKDKEKFRFYCKKISPESNICSNLFQATLLLVSEHLITQDKEKFRFYCEDVVPESETKELREIFPVLKEQAVISYEDVKFLREFTDIIGRCDVTKILLAYEMRVSLVKIIKGYLNFRSGCRVITSPPQFESDYISKRLVQDCNAVCQEDVQALTKKLQQGLPLQIVIEDFIDETYGSLRDVFTWNDVLEILKISAEVVFVEWMQMSTTKSFKRLYSDIDKVTAIMAKNVVPWMVEKGGLNMLYRYC